METANISELQIITDKWIDYDNNKRPHATLKNQTPAEYRRGQGVPPHPANFFSDFSASASLKKWIDNRTLKCY